MSKVTIRKKIISKDRESIYLDYYPPIRNPLSKKLQRREYLKLYTYLKPATKLERTHNKETSELVEYIRAQRQLDVQNRRFGFLLNTARDANFIEYFKAYAIRRQKSDADNMAMSFRYFAAFAGNQVRFHELDDFLCEDYKYFLLGGPGISRMRRISI